MREKMVFNPRPSQKKILNYTGGKMGVLAVPGSGKTQTLSCLAAQLIINGFVQNDQEILIVTLVNSAVENFSSRVETLLQEAQLMPGFGYRVRTLHGLCHDIIRERPDLVGLGEHFQIIDERENRFLLDTASQNWLKENPDFIDRYSNPEIDPFQNKKVLSDWHNLVSQTAGNFIRMAKDMQVTPEDIKNELIKLQNPPPLLLMGHDIYVNYQRMLKYREAVDFDDLIRLALQALKTDKGFLERLAFRWPYVLEDEAQDSSRLQENILRLLTSHNGNWVRVGDPNQAIYETFTTANPKYLRDFVLENHVKRFDLPESGRSTRSILELANRLIIWTKTHVDKRLQDALNEPLIKQTPKNDPQPNPPDQPEGIHLHLKKLQPDEELTTVSKSIKNWIEKNPHNTLAVLSPSNAHGAKLVESLERIGIPCINLLQINTATRNTTRILVKTLNYLVEPASKSKLIEVLDIVLPIIVDDGADKKALTAAVKGLLNQCDRIEDYLWPHPERDWLAGLVIENSSPELLRILSTFRTLITRWQEATLLPVDQLVLTISQDIYFQPSEIALGYKLALLLEMFSNNHPDWQLPQLVIELDQIANNSRRFYGFNEDETGFDPKNYSGQVVVATVHKAKGLEWDRVYLISVNNYDYPAALPKDEFVGEKWFVRQKLNLQAEALSQLNELLHDSSGGFREEGIATAEAKVDYARERLRLLYVGMTRARQQLIFTWNTGKKGKCEPAMPLIELESFWSGKNDENSQ
jgi:DNA helicase-2/ATP-dependent DNA helicase PcrA